MFRVQETNIFSGWLSSLRDVRGKAAILRRLVRVQMGNLGDAKSFGDGLFEMRVDTGPGYRLYYIWRGDVLIILLCGGDKSSQRKDIAMARKVAKEC